MSQMLSGGEGVNMGRQTARRGRGMGQPLPFGVGNTKSPAGEFVPAMRYTR